MNYDKIRSEMCKHGHRHGADSGLRCTCPLLLPDSVENIDTDSRLGYSITCSSANDIEMDKFCVWHRPVIHVTGKFQTAVDLHVK